jgi:serine/threonine protein kinase
MDNEKEGVSQRLARAQPHALARLAHAGDGAPAAAADDARRCARPGRSVTREVTALAARRACFAQFPITAIREIKILKVLNHKNVVRLKEIVTSKGTRGRRARGAPVRAPCRRVRRRHATCMPAFASWMCARVQPPHLGACVPLRSPGAEYNQGKGSIYMVMEFCDHDLTGLTDAGQKFIVPQIKCYMKQLLEGLAYCHAQKVLHRDIKGSNLLISHDGQLKLADFGLARAYDSEKQHEYTNRVITLWYRPPELLLGASMYGPAIDMWSAGCIFAELLLRKPILPGKNEFEQIDLIFKLLGTPDEAEWPRCKALKYYDLILSQVPRRYSNRFDEKFSTLDPTAKDLLRKLLTLDPEKRISADEALNHEYFWTDPMPALPAELPKYPPSHEFTAKKRRQANAQQAQQQPPAPAPAPVASTAEPHGHHDKKHDPSAPYGAGAHGGMPPPDQRPLPGYGGNGHAPPNPYHHPAQQQHGGGGGYPPPNAPPPYERSSAHRPPTWGPSSRADPGGAYQVPGGGGGNPYHAPPGYRPPNRHRPDGAGGGSFFDGSHHGGPPAGGHHPPPPHVNNPYYQQPPPQAYGGAYGRQAR